jgi:hypothetical protein
MRARTQEELFANERRVSVDTALVGEDREATEEFELIGGGVDEQELAVLCGDEEPVFRSDNGRVLGKGFVVVSPKRL